MVNRSLAEAVHFISLDHITPETPDRERLFFNKMNDEVFADNMEREPQEIITGLSTQKALLLFDNFESVIDVKEILTFLEELLKKSDVKLLITSQAQIELDFNRNIYIAPMKPPEPVGAEFSSLKKMEIYQLFKNRAEKKLNPKKIKKWLEDTGAKDIAEILKLTDGLPRAVELIAAWVDKRTGAEMLESLRQTTSEVLSRRKETHLSPERHKSIDGSLAWSYILLDEPCRKLFDSLSIFSNGFYMEAAREICGMENCDRILDELFSRSFLTSEPLDKKTRYNLLPLIRRFSWTRLNENHYQKIQKKHSSWFLKFAQKNNGFIEKGTGEEQMQAFRDMDADLDNIITGFNFSVGKWDEDYSPVYVLSALRVLLMINLKIL